MAASSDDATYTTLLDLLSNSLVLHQLAPYLSVSSRFALAATSKSFHNLVFGTPEVFRYLDLSPVKSAVIPRHAPIDSSGWISPRAERMDEALTEDEFYSGPLRGIFSKLARRYVLNTVHTMVLDGLSVPADLVREIVAEDRFNVRILSLREATHLNERKLMQVLRYACRPTRPEGTPKLKGLYVFRPRDSPLVEDEPVTRGRKRTPPRAPSGVMAAEGAQIGAEWNQKSSDALTASLAHTEHKWYQSAGRMLPRQPTSEWAETLKACEGIIHFDAVLCRGPRHDITKAYTGQSSTPHPLSYLPPAIASVALGSSGCQTCHSCPEGPATFGQSPQSHLPLLSPLNLHASTIRAAQKPSTLDQKLSSPPPLIVRCEECLRGRWCERCNKWWDEHCYVGGIPNTLTALQTAEMTEDALTNMTIHQNSTTMSSGDDPATDVKVGVKRDCFGCGPTCASCKSRYIRSCRNCRNEYCIVDNDGSSATACDWCNYSGRRTRELY